MARRRMLDPSIWDNEDIAALSDRQFRVYVWTISNADDQGRLRLQWPILHTRIYPDGSVGADEVREAIESLGAHGQVTLYTVDGKDYLQHDGWSTWQTINKPTESRFPGPEKGESYTTTVALRDDYRSTTVALPEECGSTTVALPPKRSKEKRSKENIKGPLRGGLSPLGDPLANHYQDRMTEVFPHTAWSEVSRERGQLTTLATKTRALLPTTPFEDDVGLANAILSQFAALKRTEKSDYWKNAPFSPSALSTRWSAVIAALEANYAKEAGRAEALAGVHDDPF